MTTENSSLNDLTLDTNMAFCEEIATVEYLGTIINQKNSSLANLAAPSKPDVAPATRSTTSYASKRKEEQKKKNITTTVVLVVGIALSFFAYNTMHNYEVEQARIEKLAKDQAEQEEKERIEAAAMAQAQHIMKKNESAWEQLTKAKDLAEYAAFDYNKLIEDYDQAQAAMQREEYSKIANLVGNLPARIGKFIKLASRNKQKKVKQITAQREVAIEKRTQEQLKKIEVIEQQKDQYKGKALEAIAKARDILGIRMKDIEQVAKHRQDLASQIKRLVRDADDLVAEDKYKQAYKLALGIHKVIDSALIASLAEKQKQEARNTKAQELLRKTRAKVKKKGLRKY